MADTRDESMERFRRAFERLSPQDQAKLLAKIERMKRP